MSEATVSFTFTGDDQTVMDQLIAWFEERDLDCAVGVSSNGRGYGTVPSAALDDFRKLAYLSSVNTDPELEAA